MPPAEDAKNILPWISLGLKSPIASKTALINSASRAISLSVEPTIERPAHQAIDHSRCPTFSKNSRQSFRNDSIAELWFSH